MRNEQRRPTKVIKQIPRSRHAQIEMKEEVEQARHSLLYWWYRTLKASDEYEYCCSHGGKGKLAGIYKDFGDVFSLPFNKWWVQHGRIVFAEQKQLKEVRCMADDQEVSELHFDKDRLIIEVPLTMRKQTVMRQIGRMLKTAYEGREIDIWKSSTAKRQIVKTKLRQATVEILLKVWNLKNEHSDWSNYELGVEAGIDLDLLVRDTEGQELDESLERRRMTIAVSRYLKQARALIANAERGIFPSISTKDRIE